GNFIPDKVVHDAELAAHHQGKREQEHVHDVMLEAHVEEQHDRHPHGQNLALDRGGDHRAHHAHGYHPVAQYTAQEDGEPASHTMFGITQGTGLADRSNFVPDHSGFGVETVGENKGHDGGNRQ